MLHLQGASYHHQPAFDLRLKGPRKGPFLIDPRNVEANLAVKGGQ